MDVASPPHYRRFSAARPGPVPRPGDELPAYTRRNTLAQPVIPREPTEHVYFLTEKNRPFVTLKLYSSAKSSKSLPTFFEKENINGSLEINADRGDSIHSITATVTGRIITGANAGDSFTFLNQSLPIWSKSPDVPRVPSPTEAASKNKLLGRCQWPLSIPIPRTVMASNESGSQQEYSLPETFLERRTTASIQYDFTIHISRGMLRADSQIKTAFGYVPSTRPGQASMLRQIAYQTGTSLLGPNADPDGWKTLRPVSARAVMYRSQKVEVQCLLSLAKPLTYTRGTTLPCFLTLQGTDANILNLFATPSYVNVKLQRRVRFFNKSSPSPLGWSETIEDVGTASWWPPASMNSRSGVYHLEGEIQLSKDLRPTTSIGDFTISYQIALRPFTVPHSSSESRSLLTEPVEIATMHAHGPRPKAFSPPAYASHSRPDDCYAFVPTSGGGPTSNRMMM